MFDLLKSLKFIECHTHYPRIVVLTGGPRYLPTLVFTFFDYSWADIKLI